LKVGRVLHEGAVVSHFNKATKGRLVRDLVSLDARLPSSGAIVEALRELKYTVEQPAEGRLDTVIRELQVPNAADRLLSGHG
jgi:hypothetical protein